MSWLTAKSSRGVSRFAENSDGQAKQMADVREVGERESRRKVGVGEEDEVDSKGVFAGKFRLRLRLINVQYPRSLV